MPALLSARRGQGTRLLEACGRSEGQSTGFGLGGSGRRQRAAETEEGRGLSTPSKPRLEGKISDRFGRPCRSRGAGRLADICTLCALQRRYG